MNVKDLTEERKEMRTTKVYLLLGDLSFGLDDNSIHIYEASDAEKRWSLHICEASDAQKRWS